MTRRRITGAEARELAAGSQSALALGLTYDNDAIRTLATLLAAAPDLAESLAAVEAERDALAPLAAAAERYAAARRAYDSTPRIEDDTDPCDPREAGLPCAVDEPANELARAGQALLALAALREAAK